MKKLFILIVLLIPVALYAEPCADIEYAELKDMSQEAFMIEFCRAVNLIRSNIGVAGQPVPSERILRDADSCVRLADKMSRIYLNRFKVKIDNRCGQ